MGCYIWYSKEGPRRGRSPPRPLLDVSNVTRTAHPSTTSVPITMLLYNGPLLCGFNVPVIILPFYKGKGSRHDCHNYRGITLLSVPGKVFAHVLLARVKSRLHDHILLLFYIFFLLFFLLFFCVYTYFVLRVRY